MCNKVRNRPSILAAALFVIAASCLGWQVAGAQSDAPGWVQSGDSGFGNARNSWITALEPFQETLVAGTQNWASGAELWQTTDGHEWTRLVSRGFGDPLNLAVSDLIEFNGMLYVGTLNYACNDPNCYSIRSNGGEIWRTDGVNWEKVAAGGLGDLNNLGFNAFAVLDNALYVATSNLTTGVEVWRSANGAAGSWQQVNSDGFGAGASWIDVTMEVYDGYLYVGCDSKSNPQAELYRTDNGTQWNTVFTDGLGGLDNAAVTTMASYDGYLYVGLRNSVSGGELWRFRTDQGWSRVITGGLGAASNDKPHGLTAFQGQLLLVFSNFATGAQVWRSADGLDWQAVMQDGWGKGSLNAYADYFGKAAAQFANGLYIGTVNEQGGGEVWKSLHRAFYLPLALRG